MKNDSTICAKYVLIILLPLMLFTGCDYERYTIIVGDYDVEGTAISNWRDVQAVGDFIRIKPGGRFAIKSAEYTQFLAQFDVRILSGTGANFYMRTVSHKFDPARGIMFRYAVDGCTVRTEDGRTIQLEYNADTEEETVKMLCEAEQVEFSIGCDRVYEGSSNLEATEYVIVEALPDSEIELRAINYFDIDEIH